MTPHPDAADTIAAIATPPGRGALGLVRFSGSDAVSLARQLFRPWRAGGPFPVARQAVTGSARVAAGPALPGDTSAAPERSPASLAGRHQAVASVAMEEIDTGVLIYFPAADSPTGEDLIELTLHGSPVVLRRMLAAAVRFGARPAGPGEFSYRAFLHGRLDAVQAEAIDDLIQARTEQQARVAHRQQRGALSAAVEPIRRALVDWLARIEGSLEFSATETEDFLDWHALSAGLAVQQAALDRLVSDAARGLRLRSGARVVFSGPVNTGKSSIFNKLLGIDRAIVSSIPGTTRDVVEADVDWDGLPITLVDTAGERAPAPGIARSAAVPGAADSIEKEGQRRGASERLASDLVVWVNAVDETTPLLPPEFPGGSRPLPVLNKIDLVPPAGGRATAMSVSPDTRTRLAVSARTGEGMAPLRAAILDRLAPRQEIGDLPLVTRLRQKERLEAARRAVAEAAAATQRRAGEEMLAVPIGEALVCLAELTGRGGLDEMYERIFSTFCIGK
ncbi:MAG: tRNA modification GTPase [Acidobacteriota bacterium]